MKTLIKNISEFFLAAILLYILIPVIVNLWDSHADQIYDKKLKHILLAIEKGVNQQKIEKLLRNIYSQKTNYRSVSVNVPATASNNTIVKSANGFLFSPYRLGGTSKSGIDCSGLTYLSYLATGVKIPRSVELQFLAGTYIANMDNLQIGDLIFFATSKRDKATHVGLYVGDNKMIHASSKFKKVLCVSINKSYYKKRFLGGKRIIKSNAIAQQAAIRK